MKRTIKTAIVALFVAGILVYCPDPTCTDGTYLSGTDCLPCDSKCAKCTGGTDSTCSECATGFNLQPAPSDNTCSATCPDGYWSNNKVCTKCESTCLTCTAGTANDCATCADGRFFDTSDGSNKKCTLCANTCLTCTAGTANDCSTCGTGRFFDTSDGSNKKCTSCNETCLTCTAGTANDCATCETGRFFDTSDGSNKKCTSCNAACSGCTAAGATGCTACAANFYNYTSSGTTTCQNPCPTGWYEDSNVCVQCDGACSGGCTGAGPTKCSACAATYYNYTSGGVTTCQLSCPDGTWTDTPNQKCAACDSKCAKCTDGTASTCSECATGFNLQPAPSETTCSATCPDGYWSKDKVCTKCEGTCLTCTAGTANDCATCETKRFLDTSDGSNKKCTLCDDTCLTCTAGTANNCATCGTGRFLDTSGGGSNKKCTSCNAACSDCTAAGATDCTACATNYLNHTDGGTTTCVASCPAQWYASSATICSKCHTSCATCSAGNAATQCTSCTGVGNNLHPDGTCSTDACPSGYYTGSNVCKSCDTACNGCTGAGPTLCQACKSGYFTYTSGSTTTCVNSCPSGTYASGTSCLECHSNCAACSGATKSQCSACKSGFYLQTDGVTCDSGCPSGYFTNSTTSKCDKCDAICGTCSGTSKTCTSCTSPAVFYQQQSTCLGSCPSGYFALSGMCFKCDSNCTTCDTTSKSCTSCASGFLLHATSKECISSCPEGTFQSGSSCIPCNSNCLTCSGSASKCTACTSSEHAVSPYNKVCLPICSPTVNYQSFEAVTCTFTGACDITCLDGSCLSGSSGQCVTCRDPLTTLSQGSCNCATGFQMSLTTGYCEVIPSATKGCDLSQPCPVYNENLCQCLIKGMLLQSQSGSPNTGSTESTTVQGDKAVNVKLLDSTSSFSTPITVTSARNFTASGTVEPTTQTVKHGVDVPSSIFSNLQASGQATTGVAAVAIVYASNPHNETTKSQNVSNVMTVTFMDATTSTVLSVKDLQEPLKLYFPIVNVTILSQIQYVRNNTDRFPSQNLTEILGSISSCSYYSPSEASWHNDGMALSEINDTTITCHAYHTTDFGLSFGDVQGWWSNNTASHSSPWDSLLTTSVVSNFGFWVVIISIICYIVFGTAAKFADFQLLAMMKAGDESSLIVKGVQMLLQVMQLDDRAASAKQMDIAKGFVRSEEELIAAGKPTQPHIVTSEYIAVGNPAVTPGNDNNQRDLSPDVLSPSTVARNVVMPYKTGDPESYASHQEALKAAQNDDMMTLWKKLNPIANTITQTYVFPARLQRFTLYFTSVMMHFLFTLVFFAPVESTIQHDAGQVIWQGLAASLVIIMVMYLITFAVKFPKELLMSGQLFSSPAEIEKISSRATTQARILYGLSAFIVLFSWAIILMMGPRMTYDQASDWLKVFVTSYIWDQIIFELLIMSVIYVLRRIKSYRALKILMDAKYMRSILVA